MKKNVLLLAVLCIIMVVASCSNQQTDPISESAHGTDAPNQPTTAKPEPKQSSGLAFQRQTLDIGQAYDRIINATPRNYGKLVTIGDKIIYVNDHYKVTTSNPDGSEAVNIFTCSSNGGVVGLTLHKDELFFVEKNNGLYRMIDNKPRMLVEGHVGRFEISNEQLFFNIYDIKENTNQMYMCDLNGSNKKMIANLDNRQDIFSIFKSTGGILGQKEQMIYYSVREEYDFEYYVYDSATDNHKKIDIEEINKEEIGYYTIPYNTVFVNGIRFAVEPDDNEKYTLSVTDMESGTVYAQTNVKGDIIHVVKDKLYIFGVNQDIEYFELRPGDA